MGDALCRGCNYDRAQDRAQTGRVIMFGRWIESWREPRFLSAPRDWPFPDFDPGAGRWHCSVGDGSYRLAQGLGDLCRDTPRDCRANRPGAAQVGGGPGLVASSLAGGGQRGDGDATGGEGSRPSEQRPPTPGGWQVIVNLVRKWLGMPSRHTPPERYNEMIDKLQADRTDAHKEADRRNRELRDGLESLRGQAGLYRSWLDQ